MALSLSGIWVQALCLLVEVWDVGTLATRMWAVRKCQDASLDMCPRVRSPRELFFNSLRRFHPLFPDEGMQFAQNPPAACGRARLRCSLAKASGRILPAENSASAGGDLAHLSQCNCGQVWPPPQCLLAYLAEWVHPQRANRRGDQGSTRHRAEANKA